jgi:hypothetical protein
MGMVKILVVREALTQSVASFYGRKRVTIVKEREKTGAKAVCAKYDISDQSYRNRRYKALF